MEYTPLKISEDKRYLLQKFTQGKLSLEELLTLLEAATYLEPMK